MSDQEYNKLIETLKEKYYWEPGIVKEYKFRIKDTEYTAVLGYSVSKSEIRISAMLVIFQDAVLDIKYLFEQTDFTCIVNIIDNRYYIYMRKGLEQYEKRDADAIPNQYAVLFRFINCSNLFLFCALLKGVELYLAKVVIMVLRFTIPPLGKKIWKYYTNPYNRVVRKKDVDKLPF